MIPVVEQREVLRRRRLADGDPRVDLLWHALLGRPREHHDTIDVAELTDQRGLACPLRCAAHRDLRPLGRAVVLHEPRPSLGRVLVGQVSEELRQPVVDAVRRCHGHVGRNIGTGEDLEAQVYRAVVVKAMSIGVETPAALADHLHVVLVHKADNVIAQARGLLLEELPIGRHVTGARHEDEELGIPPRRRVEPDVVVSEFGIDCRNPGDLRVGRLRCDEVLDGRRGGFRHTRHHRFCAQRPRGVVRRRGILTADEREGNRSSSKDVACDS